MTEVERPLYCKLMSGCFVCFTGFRKENKHTVAHCIKLVHYMGGSVRKEYNKKITHLIVKSTLSTKYKVSPQTHGPGAGLLHCIKARPLSIHELYSFLACTDHNRRLTTLAAVSC